jgi:hypothetical protein
MSELVCEAIRRAKMPIKRKKAGGSALFERVASHGEHELEGLAALWLAADLGIAAALDF